MEKDNSSSKSELRAQMDKLNELKTKEEKKLRKLYKENGIIQQILQEIIDYGIIEFDDEKLNMETCWTEEVEFFLDEEDKKECEQTLLYAKDAKKAALKVDLERKMFRIFSGIMERLAEQTGLPFYITKKYSMSMPYSAEERKVYFERFEFKFTVDIH